ncbi:hypothetical protein C8R47DRAFT_1209219 [Mycena vitilis]|nr:hypothetical protein C8R47DRAFT_1209219 [Mycena vitilis]
MGGDASDTGVGFPEASSRRTGTCAAPAGVPRKLSLQHNYNKLQCMIKTKRVCDKEAQTHVVRVLGVSIPSSDPTYGQATLPSVIARAQFTQARRATHATDVVAPLAPAPAPPSRARPSSFTGSRPRRRNNWRERWGQSEGEAQAALEEAEESGDEDHPNTSSMSPPSPA